MTKTMALPTAKRPFADNEAAKKRILKAARIDAKGTSFSGNGTMTEKELDEGFKAVISQYDLRSW